MSNAKQRLLQAGETLFRRQGYSGSGLKELVQTAEAPWGSLYHYFPGGKEQLGAEVMAYAGERYGAVWEKLFVRGTDPVASVFHAFEQEARLLESSDYRSGCPVGAVTLDVASSNDQVRLACDDAFRQWTKVIADHFAAAGLPPSRAEVLADFVMAAMEGAIVLSRAAKSPTALQRTGEVVRNALAAEFAAAQTAGVADPR